MYPNFSYITVFLKIRNIISKNKRSKATDLAALNNFGLHFIILTSDYSYNMVMSLIYFSSSLSRRPKD